MAKKPTQADRLRWNIDATKHQVLALLGWNSATYQALQWEQGLDYLLTTLNYNEEQIRAVYETDIYHGWWKRHWYQRDLQFLEEAEAGQWNRHKCRFLYRKLHDADDLSMAKTDHGKVLEESYSRDLVPMLK